LRNNSYDIVQGDMPHDISLLFALSLLFPMESIHESFDREETVKTSSDRGFGLVMAAAFGVLALLGLILGRGHWVWCAILAALFLAVALAQPGLLSPLNKLWTRFGLLLHSLASPLALFVIFYLVMVPIGLTMRLFGKDPLRLCFEPDADTYWIRREPPGPLPDSLKNQF
jgi:hypothetical protein